MRHAVLPRRDVITDGLLDQRTNIHGLKIMLRMDDEAELLGNDLDGASVEVVGPWRINLAGLVVFRAAVRVRQD